MQGQEGWSSWLLVGIDRFTLHAPPGSRVFSHAGQPPAAVKP